MRIQKGLGKIAKLDNELMAIWIQAIRSNKKLQSVLNQCYFLRQIACFSNMTMNLSLHHDFVDSQLNSLQWPNQ